MFKLTSMVTLLLAFAAPLVSANLASPGCNKWRSHHAPQGDGFIKSFVTKDHAWCMKECQNLPGCVAATWTGKGRKCGLWKAAADALLGPKRGTHTWVICPKCDDNTRHQKIEGGKLLMTPFVIKDMWWCRKKCMNTDNCNAFHWNVGGTRKCSLLHVKAGQFERVEETNVWAGLVCKNYSLLPVCGGQGELACKTGCDAGLGLSVTNDQTCDCGGEWGTCCEGALATDGPCDDGLDCNKDKRCQPCGGDWQACCADDKCSSAGNQRRTCGGNEHYKQCRPCGGMWQDVCSGPKKCDHGLMPDMHAGTQCVMMGTD